MEEFIKTLTEQMRCAKARDGVARELANHITDQADAYEQSGMEHEKAVAAAVHEMGDPVEIGVSMDRIHRPQTNWRMILLTFLLNLAGLFCMVPVHGWDYVLFRQGMFVLAGAAVIAMVYFIDYTIIGRIGVAAYIALTVIFFICSHSMHTINGRIPAMAMLVYLYVPVFAGILYQLRMKGYRAVLIGLVTIGVTFVALLYYSSTLVTAGNIVLIMTIMLFAAIRKGMFGKEKRKMTILAVMAVIVPGMFLLWMAGINSMGFRVQRLNAFFHRSRYREGVGYIYAVIEDVLRNARFVGTGSSQYFENFADSALEGELLPLSIVYCYGILAGMILLLLLMVYVFHMFRVVRGQKNQLGYLVSMSCCLVIFFNSLEGVLVTVGWLPVTTTVMPFLTRGGSAAFVYAVLIGLLLGVHRYEKVYTTETYVEQPRWRVSLKVEKR